MPTSILFPLMSASAPWLVQGPQMGHFMPKCVWLQYFVWLTCHFEYSFKLSGRTDNLQLATAPTSLGLKLLELLALTVSCLDPKGTATSLEWRGAAWGEGTTHLPYYLSMVKNKQKKLFIHLLSLFKYNEKSPSPPSWSGILKEWLGQYVVGPLRPSQTKHKVITLYDKVTYSFLSSWRYAIYGLINYLCWKVFSFIYSKQRYHLHTAYGLVSCLFSCSLHCHPFKQTQMSSE